MKPKFTGTHKQAIDNRSKDSRARAVLKRWRDIHDRQATASIRNMRGFQQKTGSVLPNSTLGSAMMDRQQTEAFRAKLIDQREVVSAEMQFHRVAPSPDGKQNPEDLAVRNASNFVETRITEDHENLLAKIEYALERIEAGSYQQCANCGKEIPIERLLAKPSASLCVPCQELKDAGNLS